MSGALQKFTLERHQAAPVPATVDEAIRLGEIMAKSGLFSDSRDVGKAVAKVIAGRELGIGPMAAMTGINIIQGRVTLSANLVAGLIKRSGRYDYRATVNDAGAEVVFYERGMEIGRSSFTLDDAKRANLAGDNWKKYPRDMCFARCITAGARRHCPDIFSGPIFVPEDVGAETDPETGEVVGGASEPIGSPDPAPAQTEQFRERYETVVEAARAAGRDDLAPVWRAAGVSVQRDLDDVDKFRAAMEFITGPPIEGEVVGEGEAGDGAGSPDPADAELSLPVEEAKKRRKAEDPQS